MNDQIKMRSKRRSHLLPAMALLQLLLTALLVFAAGGGSYNLSVTDSSTNATLPIVATTNTVGTTYYITNYLAIDTAMTNVLNFQITPTNTLSNVTWNFSNAIQTPAGPLTGNSAMVTLNTNSFPTNITPVTINSQRTDSSGAICKTAQTVVMLVPVQFRLLNGDTNSADVDGEFFDGTRPTTITATTDYNPTAIPWDLGVDATSNSVGYGNSGFDVLGPDTNLGEGRGDGPGTSYAFSLLFTAKVCPASTPGVSYGWNRVFQRRFVTIRPVTTLTTNYWYVDSADSSDYPTGIPTPRPDVDEGHWHTSIPSTDNNVVVMYDDPAMNLAYLTNYDNGIGINANLIVNEYAYQKILFTYTLTNSIGSANLLAIQQVGFISVAQKMHTNDVIATDWVGKSNIVTTSTIPDCTNVTLSEIRNIVGGTNAIVIDPEVTNNY